MQSFSVTSALEAAAGGRLEDWLHAYLTGGDWANPALSDGLKLQKRWWRGPLKLPLSALTRVLGPEAGMEFRVDPQYWDWRTRELADAFNDPLAIPPLIAMYERGVLEVRDGNHRLGAMQRLGWPECWAVIWYNSEEEYRQHQIG